MLVLTRKANETILIGDDVEIYVVAVQGDRVKLGVRAPQSHKVLRGELTRRDNPAQPGTVGEPVSNQLRGAHAGHHVREHAPV